VSEQRLKRIEIKLDEVGKAIVALARVEERVLAILKRMDVHQSEISTLDDRVAKLELNAGKNGQALRFAERCFWIVATSGVGYLFF
jgi:hypothetical protein